MLEKEFCFYRANQDNLVAQYDGRFVVIANNSVVGDYGSYLEAYVKTKQNYRPGTFLIQECSAGNRAYTVTCHNRYAE